MSLQHVTLGLLKYGPLSGYDLNKAFQASVFHFWNTEQSQVYRALYKLAESGWVDVETIVQADLPNKKLYRLTAAGRRELQRWVATPAPLAATHEAWLGQLFFGAELSTDELIQVLNARIAALQQMLEHFTTQIPASAAAYAEDFAAPHDLPFWQLTLEYGIEKLRFDLEWAQRCVATLQKRLDSDVRERDESS
ncbi:MAG: PadR family transcriptional regulator [Roseiflexaceae bacterium]